jgi:proline iminopeptidase
MRRTLVRAAPSDPVVDVPRTSGVAGGSRPWGRPLAVVAVAGGAGLLLGSAMPRGPLSTSEALVGMATCAVVGAVVGALVRSRWSLLLAPVVFGVAFEIVRIAAAGPTVDAPRWSVLGGVAFVLGRGVDAVLLLLPMVVGATWGGAWARRQHEVPASRTARSHRWATARTIVAGLLTGGLVVLAVVLARPAATDPILGPDGRPLAGSVAELSTVRIGGHDQVLMIRGQREDAPVLLWLAGGPGGSDIGPMRNLGGRLESEFVVVTWDQRGAGKSYRTLEPTETMTLEQAVTDTLEVTDHLRERFDEPRIYLAGNSWGTLPSVLAAGRHPEKFHAFVGAGQMVDIRETDELFFEDTLSYARAQGDTALESELEALGPPPYDDFLDYEIGVFGGEGRWNDYPRVPGSRERGELPANVLAREFALIEGVRAGGAALDTLAVLYPRLQEVDLRVEAPSLEVPVYLVQGRHEARGRAEPAAEWFGELDAPDKELIVFERSGHRPMFEEPDRFFEVMTDVLARTQPTNRLPDLVGGGGLVSQAW